MNRPQRIVLIVYCVLVTYCCVWVPWHVVQGSASDGFQQFRTGYGWLWNGPSNFAEGRASIYATPDVPIIGLRLLAVTAVAGVAFCVGTWKQD